MAHETEASNRQDGVVDYISTRGNAPALGFTDTLCAGLARDGGLYLPVRYPQISGGERAGFAGMRYQDVAHRVLYPFIEGEISADDFACLIEDAYAGFSDAAIAPLVPLGRRHFILELFHGPSLAFKDIAMQLLARLTAHILRGRNMRATIIGATSGDTGGAAIEAFRGLEGIDVFVLYPHGRVSDVQRRQMTTSGAENIHSLAIEGTFDDCQNLVKAMFNDLAFRDALALTGVNSINWARVMAQIVYYFTASAGFDGAPIFSVPTGNFGDIFAGFVAAQMGLPMSKLIIATNVNDILARALSSGSYRPRGVVATSSPSMDIQISSNFERQVFEALGRDSERLTGLMAGLKAHGHFDIPADAQNYLRRYFAAARIDEATMAATQKSILAQHDILLDPHSAVGVAAAFALEDELIAQAGDVGIISLATAHPAKFPQAVAQATGIEPPLPPHLAALMSAPERIVILPNEYGAVQEFIRAHANL